MKRKITALCVVVAMLAVAIIGGTMAYFTDTDEAVNVMTMGNVKIELIEQQREIDADGNKTANLVDFEDGKQLEPIVADISDVDALGLPTTKNFEDKIVSIKNTGKSDAYVRVIVGVPQALESVGALHLQLGDSAWSDVNTYDTTTINNIVYNIHIITYNAVLEAGDTAANAMFGFYLDSKVDFDGTNYTMDGAVIPGDFTGDVNIPVMGQAVQSSGFDAPAAAFTAAGMPNNPWTDLAFDTSIYATPENVQEIIAAAETGDTVYLTNGKYDEIIVKNADGTHKSGITLAAFGDVEVGFLNLNGSSHITVDGIVFNAADSKMTYSYRTPTGTGYVANITGTGLNQTDSALTVYNYGASNVVIKNCTFTGTPANAASYVPVVFDEQGRATVHANNITVDNNVFECNALNYVRMNYLTTGTTSITNNIFGGSNFATEHNTMNFTGNNSSLVITGNKFYNWNVEKNAIGTSRGSEAGVLDVTITGNTFRNIALVGEGGVIELKSSYTTANANVNISGNFYEGALASYTDATAPIVKPQ